MSSEVALPPDEPADRPANSIPINKLLRRVRRMFLPPPAYDLLAKTFDRLLGVMGLVPGPDIEIPARNSDARNAEGDQLADDDYDDDDDDLDADEEADRPEGRILVLIGETGAGKSRSLKRLFRQRREIVEEVLVSVVAPSPCTLMQLGRKMLPELGYPIQRDRKEHLIWEDVRRRIDAQGVRIVHIDEMQHVTQTANVDQKKRILNTIKSLIQGREKPMLLVLSGTCELADFLRTDGQVRRRCKFVELKRLSIEGDVDLIADTLEDLIELTPLKLEHTVVEDLAARLIHGANYALGITMEIACDAIEEAFLEGSGKLRPSHFAEVYRSRSGCPNSSNPFLAVGWRETDPQQVLDRPRADIEPTNPKASKSAPPAVRKPKKPAGKQGKTK
ncbi:ATP-binding protein [Methylobacterium haplocladii]|uniref:ORC1/DEAH AAA+ ATPase domain-containing protein n=1 Tax=Methylobacterium haplocladii TaxID=1176176 RepID=A0A512IVM0_9HYPH|nr:ATP-binding protein [Methylobacterium haplocladii]GEP01726.1 hypothetical protein MHA02_41130 [Methylobacterium haplocladii]GJD85323.1 hypothetical protein HPGCJGGD_3211 [Methylobacterium haplocladii]GLS59392.1 hypothetical protein GCM10007887_20580 [Methylobacterium haplocladii]